MQHRDIKRAAVALAIPEELLIQLIGLGFYHQSTASLLNWTLYPEALGNLIGDLWDQLPRQNDNPHNDDSPQENDDNNAERE